MAVVNNLGDVISDGDSVEHYLVGADEYTVQVRGHFVVQALGTAGSQDTLTVYLRARELVPAA